MYCLTVISLLFWDEPVDVFQIALAVAVAIISLGLARLQEWARIAEIVFSWIQVVGALGLAAIWLAVGAFNLNGTLKGFSVATLLVVSICVNVLLIWYFSRAATKQLFRERYFDVRGGT